ncbi:hypothetical protein F511_46100 [Dorcoceras hygrometricum]|uniref:Uncharacterized protein n=1 Tax=Dorcoceras hygrometricum TaxID=472368 RepID=A0A2Z6ZUE1_9LAMI|nr:hypothetical protein F511_46100 [Dorcoceras hygrometricum]
MVGDTLRAGRATRTLVAAPLDSPGANRCADGRDMRAPRAAAAYRGRTSLLALVACLGRWLAARRCTRWRDVEAPLRYDGRTLAKKAGRSLHDDVACWLRASALAARCCARRRAPPCEIFRWRRPPAGRRSGAAPASFQRCRDGWSEFF